MKSKKKHIPWWARYRVACPNCGLEYKENDYADSRLVRVRTPNTLAIHDTIIVKKCSRCGYVPDEEDEFTAPWRKDAILPEDEE